MTVVGSNLGNSKGRIEIEITGPNSTSNIRTIEPIIRAENWSSLSVDFNLFYDGFDYSEFTLPLTLRLFDSTGNLVQEARYPFSDVPVQEWYAPYVVDLWKRGALDGDGGNFRPGDDITRAELIKVLAVIQNKVCDISAFCPDEPDYVDVSPGDWFYPYVKAAINHGWLDTDQTFFRPHDPINRAEVAKLVSIVLGLTPDPGDPLPYSFSDVSNSEWYWYYVTAVADARLMTGDRGRNFRPGDAINRAESAKVFASAFPVEGPILDNYLHQGKVVVLVHGLASSGESWGGLGSSMIGRLEEEGYEFGGNYRSGVFYSPSGQASTRPSRADLFTISFSNNSNLTLAEQASELGAMLNQLVSALRPNEVTLIGHSMGGLASRAYLELPAEEAVFGTVPALRISKEHARNRSIVTQLITLNTPHQGSPWPRIVEAVASGTLPAGDSVASCTVADMAELVLRQFSQIAGNDTEELIDKGLAWLKSQAALQLLLDTNVVDPDSELWTLKTRAENERLAIYDRTDAFFFVTTAEVDVFALPPNIIQSPAFWFPLPYWHLDYQSAADLTQECLESVRQNLYAPFFEDRHLTHPALEPCNTHDWAVCDSSQASRGDDFPSEVRVISGQWHVGSQSNTLVMNRVAAEVGPSGH